MDLGHLLAGAVLGAAGLAITRSSHSSTKEKAPACPEQLTIAHTVTGVRSCGIDIGGSNCKVAADCGDGSLLLVQWPTSALAEAIIWVRAGNYKVAGITGGGGKKFHNQLHAAFGLTRCVDEIDAFVSGLEHCRNAPENSYFRQALTTTAVAALASSPKTSPWQPMSITSPYIVAMIGTGTSIVKVNSKVERVNGTCYGGGTYWGLQRLVTGVDSFEELEALVVAGNANNVDMLVGDIYGDATAELGLPADLLASSLAKVSDAKHGKADIACSVLRLTCWTIGQLASLEAQRCEARDVFFVGGFVKEVAKEQLAFATAFGAGPGSKRAVFLDGISGFLGALGAGLDPTDRDV